MATVTVSIVTASQSFPAGTVAGPIKVTLGDVFLEQEDGPFVFEDVDVGSYTVTAERMDGNGATLGSVVSATFAVTASATDINIPVDIDISQT